MVIKIRRSMNPQELKGRVVVLQQWVKRRTLILEARWKRRRAPMKRALAEFSRVLDHLKHLEVEGRYPRSLLAPALFREELRINHLQEEMRKLDETFHNRLTHPRAKARQKAANWAARSGVELDLDAFFPEVEGELNRDAAGH
jgi:hypothetical protein